jgi:hypothetical protein
MKRLNVLVLVGFVFGWSTAWAQDTDGVTDDQLRKYAVAMDSIDNMRTSLMATITDMVKNNSALTAARYNELSKIITDEEKLSATNATAEEIEAVKVIIQTKDEGTAEIQSTFQSLAKDYVGAAVYNKVKKALASDAEVKSRYDTIFADVSKDTTE